MTPADVFAEGLAFRLGLGEEERQDHLIVHIEGVRVLFLEEYPDAEPLELPDDLYSLQRVAGKPRSGLRDHQVDFSLLTIIHQLQEFLALLHGGAADPLVSVQAHHTRHRSGKNSNTSAKTRLQIIELDRGI